MKIKIPPYPNFKITDEAIKSIDTQSVSASNQKPLLSNNLVMIAKFKDGQKRVLKSRPIESDGNKYLSVFPNPIHLYLSLSIDNYIHSDKVRQSNFPKCGKRVVDNYFILDIEADGTHNCYNEYIKYRASSIIMLVSAIEAFMNHIIPNEFIYEKTIKGKIEKLHKEDIEGVRVTFREKLETVIPQSTKKDNLWMGEGVGVFKILNELYNHRISLIHLKTNAQKDFDRYFDAINNMLEFDLQKGIQASISFMNSVSPNFIEMKNQ